MLGGRSASAGNARPAYLETKRQRSSPLRSALAARRATPEALQAAEACQRWGEGLRGSMDRCPADLTTAGATGERAVVDCWRTEEMCRADQEEIPADRRV